MRPSDLDPERWAEIDALLEAALEIAPAEQAAFLETRCADDPMLRAEVWALLQALSTSASRFDPPAAGLLEEALGSRLGEQRNVGRFRLVREIGRGGMGVVYLAEDTRLGRPVALKVLPPWLGMRARARARFEAEARTVSGLDHPNIATLYEIDETEDGQPYMVFAYYEGETLEARIHRGPLPPEEAVTIAIGIAEGLGAAHQSGAIHRDVKPSNVLLAVDGVKLLDFGVAKMAGEELTGEGVRLGTIAYMSPEQVGTGPIDLRSDLWSLGVVLYEMLTGIHPFGGTDVPSMLRAILDEHPKPLSSFGRDLSDALQRVMDKLLHKDRSVRYQDTKSLLTDLRAVRAHEPPPVAVREPPPSPSPRVRRLAVLPLVDLTGNPDEDPIVRGLHHALIAQLGKVRSLSVVSRTSVERFRDAQEPPATIARLLDVEAVLEGSVSRVGTRIALTAQLIAVSPERDLWSGTYQRTIEGIFDMAADLARAVAAELEILLTPSEERRLGPPGSVMPEAYEAYAAGLLYLERRSPEGHQQAQLHLRRAIRLDPEFGQAHAMLADAYGSAAVFGLLSPAEALPRARSLVDRALALDPGLPVAQTVLGAILHFGDWDWGGAEAALRRAIALNPSHAYAHFMLAEVLSVQRRYREALASAERHRALEPFLPLSAFGPVIVLNDMRDFDRAMERAETANAFFTNFWQGPWFLVQSLLGKGLHARAVLEAEKAVTLSNRTPMALGALGVAYALDGRDDDAKRVLAELTTLAATAYVGATNLAMIHGALGEHEEAFDWLERAYLERDMALPHVGDDVFYDSLRSDRRFDAFLRRMGLAGSPASPASPGGEAARP